jgi:hypothetical protein
MPNGSAASASSIVPSYWHSRMPSASSTAAHRESSPQSLRSFLHPATHGGTVCFSIRVDFCSPVIICAETVLNSV